MKHSFDYENVDIVCHERSEVRVTAVEEDFVTGLCPICFKAIESEVVMLLKLYFALRKL